MLRVVLIFTLVVGCQQGASKDRPGSPKPSDQGEGLPGYLDETEVEVGAGEERAINIGSTLVAIPAGATTQSTKVRLRRLESSPDRGSSAAVGEAQGDVVQLELHEGATKTLQPSLRLEQSDPFSQILADLGNIEDLKYVIISAPGTGYEAITLIAAEGITTYEKSWRLAVTVASIALRLTPAIVYAVSVSDDAPRLVDQGHVVGM